MFRVFFAALLVVTFFGCGSNGPKLAKTHGKVIYKKAPVKFGSVIFQHESGKLATGDIQPDGTFALKTDDRDGALIGNHRVRVVSLTTQDPNYKLNPGQEMPLGKSLIPEKFDELENTPLKEEVKDIELNTITIDLGN